MIGGIKSLFKADNIDEKTIYRGGNFGETFGMTENRYRSILFSLRLKGPKLDGIGVVPWQEVRDFVNAFNINQQLAVIPGDFMVIDEIMSAWRGLDREFSDWGMPHVSKVIRKPAGVGAEMKAIACGESGIIMGLDIMEKKCRNAI